MRLLLLFLKQHHITIVFIILEMFGVILLSRSNTYHNAKIGKSFQSAAGYFTQTFNAIDTYLTLKHENEALLRENATLYNELSKIKQNYFYTTSYDTSPDRKYIYIPAQVINNSTNKQHNYITIDKGAYHGIEENMAVIGPQGIVGVVKAVSKNYALIISVLNRDFYPNARIKSSDFFGPVEWPGKNYQYVELKDIPMHAKFNIGDTIVTSGFSAVFPKNIDIGTIKKSEVEQGIQLNFKVKLFTDYKQLQHVQVIKNNHQQEQIELEQQVINE